MKNELPIVSPLNLSNLVTKVENQLNLVEKILNHDSILSLNWWYDVPLEWKRHFLFHISYFYEINSNSQNYMETYDKWYKKTNQKQFKPKLKINEEHLKDILDIEALRLPFCSLTNLEPISKLKNLHWLELRFNDIQEISS